MDELIGPFLALSCLIGLVLAGLSVVWLARSRPLTPFKKIVVTFVLIGVLIPAAVAPIWLWSHKHVGAVVAMEHFVKTFWPTSIALMALEGPSPWSAIILIYSFSILANIGLYGTVGLLLAYLYRNVRRTRLARLVRPAP